MSTPPFGVLIVGAGDMGARHAVHWREAGALLVGVYDPDQTRAEALASRFGCRSLQSLEAALELRDAEVVSVCTPTFLHAPQTIAALRAGKHVLCEKPAALRLEEAYAMKDAEFASGKLLRIGFMRRFDAAFDQLRTFGATLGGPLLLQATVAAGVRPKLLMHDANANGGPIIDMCCHIFDQWGLLLGEQPSGVRAHGYTFSGDKPEVASIERKALDSAQFTLTYPGGSVGQVQVSWGLPSGIPPIERHTYMGPNGLITVDWPDELTLHGTAGTTSWSSRRLDPWRAEIRAFAHELATGVPSLLATIDDGIAALRVSLSVLASVAGSTDVRPSQLEGDPVSALSAGSR